MPRKVFVAGEILTAADVNTNLMDQAVMVFDDATARTTAIPTPVEGMVTYLEDVGGAQGLEVFDGAVFTPVAVVPEPAGLVEVKHVLKTDTFTASVAAGDNVAVTDLSITHEVANADNRLIISAFFGVAAHPEAQGQVGIAIHDGTDLIGVGNASGTRTRVSAGGRTVTSGNNRVVVMPHISFVHTPGTGAKTYTVRAINPHSTSVTLFINRSQGNEDGVETTLGVSSLIIQEVSV